MPDFESLEDSGGVFVTPKTATRIITDLDKVERTPTENGRRRGHKNGQFIEQFVDVSDNTTTDGFYPCDAVCYNATTGGWQTFGSGWLKGPLGSEVFSNGDRVFARLNGTKASDGKPIWIAASSSAAATVLDECCDTNMVHGGGLSFGGGLVFGGAHCGCKPHCGCGGGSGGGGSGTCSDVCPPGWSMQNGQCYPTSYADNWGTPPPICCPPGTTWGQRPDIGGGYTGVRCVCNGTPGFVQYGNPETLCHGGSTMPGGGVGGIPPGTFPPSQPGQNVGGPTKPWGGCPPGFKPRPDGLPGCCNGSWYWSGGQWLCDDSGNAPIPRFTPTQSLANAISFGGGVTLSGPPAPFLFANQGGLGIDASMAASGQVPIADGAGSFTMGTPSSSPANAQWLKLTKTYTDFSTAAFSQTITLRTFAAKEVLFSCIVKHSTNFQGGGITAYTIDVSDVTGVLLPGHITAFDAKQAVGNTAFQIGTRATGTTDTAFTDVSFAGANMLIKASCDGGHTLNQATQGSIDIWLLIGTMP